MRDDPTASGPGGRRPDGTTHLRSLWNFALRNRLFTIGVPAVTIVAAFVFVQNVAPTYQASSWLRVDDQESGVPVLEALRTISQGSQIETEMEVLRRRPLAERVVDSLSLQFVVGEPATVPREELFDEVDVAPQAMEAAYRLERREDGRFDVVDEELERAVATASIGERVALPDASFVLAPGAAEWEELEIGVARFEDAVGWFRETVRVTRPNRDADVMAIFYEHTDTELVQAVPNALAEEFIEYRQDVRTSEARGTVEFLTGQIGRVADQLRAAERELREFREGANLVDLEMEASTQLQRLATLQAERDRLDAERQALQQLFDRIRVQADTVGPLERSPYRDLIAFPSLLQNFAVSELFRSLAEVENERAELLNLRRPADPDVQVLTGRIQELEAQLRNIATIYLEGLTNQVASLDETLSEFQEQLGLVPAEEIQFMRLQREATVLEEIYTLLQTRLQESEVAAAVEDARIRVVEPAVRPLDPIRPNKPLTMILAMVLGTVLGVGAAFARENMDTTVRTREDLRALTEDSPVLGLIPRIEEAAGGGIAGLGRDDDGRFEDRLVTGRDPRNPVSEAYRSLRTNITFARPEAAPTSLVFTSPTPGDGKSTTVANLAITLAQQDVRVLLIDADMRRGLLHDVFGVPREPGLSNVILNRRTFEEALQRIDVDESSGALDFLPSGTLPPNPAELLGSSPMRELMERLEAEYEAILLDAPPLNLVTDGALLGTYADGVLLVARSGKTDEGAITYAMEQIRAVRAPLLGTVLNDIDTKRQRYYGTYGTGAHSDYYGSQT
ncbi:MAG: GumC family protein [Gemmatimonadota bacterium]